MQSLKPFRRVKDVLYYENEPVCLAGRLPENVDLPLPPDPKLNPLVQYKNNLYRHWMIAYWLYSHDNATPNHAGRANNCPFLYNTGTKKWNLTQYNQGYFTRLRATIKAAQDRGIVVVVSLFDRSGLAYVTSDRARRWPHNPWNAANNVNGVIMDTTGGTNSGGLPEFFRIFGTSQHEQTLKALQQQYIQKVVAETKNYWNVFYELMNEPYVAGATDERVRWANWAAGIIHSTAGGTARKQLIAYNDNANGGDMNHWRSKKNLPGYTNYGLVDLVAIHGDPNTVDPDKTTLSFRSEKVFLVSSDGGPTNLRDRKDWNRTTTTYAFSRDMQFTAFSHNNNAACGVGESAPSPSPLLRPALLSHWQKIWENPQTPVPDNYHLRFYADGSFTTFFSDPFAQLDPGYVVEYLGNRRLKLFNAAQNNETIWDYWFGNGGSELHLRSNGFEQVYKRLPQPEASKLNRFLYHWRKIGEHPASPTPDDYHLRFYADGSFDTFFIDPYRPADRGEVRTITTTKLDLFNVNQSALGTWTYSFRNSGKTLRLTRTTDGYWQDYQRYEKPTIHQLVRFAFKWDKFNEIPANPNVPDQFRLHFHADASFTVTNLNSPYQVMERGEVRAVAGNRITLWSHTRSVESEYVYTFRNRANELSLKNTSDGFEQVFKRTK